jgi:AcrR family transcriptional regulator
VPCAAQSGARARLQPPGFLNFPGHPTPALPIQAQLAPKAPLDRPHERSILADVAKGEATRQAILAHAFELAKTLGLSGLSIGRLAEDTGLSKSGLFAHFGSKEALEVAVVDEAARQFVSDVMLPALRQPRGEPRVRALFERWLSWGQRPGGCFFVGAVAELDDRPGPPRDALIQTCRDWLDALATAARITITEGHFRSELDPDQFAFELYSVMLGFHTYHKFLRAPEAHARAHAAFERLLSGARAPAARSR